MNINVYTYVLTNICQFARSFLLWPILSFHWL